MSRIDALGAVARLAREIQAQAHGGFPTIAGLERAIGERRGIKAATRTMLVHTARLLAQWADGNLSGRRHTRIDDITRADASRFARWLDDGEGGDMGATTVAKHLRDCRTIWNAVYDSFDAPPVNPWARRRWAAPRVASDWQEITLKDLGRLMDAAAPPGSYAGVGGSIRLALAIARLAGLRAGEIRRLRWADVDLGRRMITVLPEANERGERIEGTKQRARTVPMRPELAAELEAARAAAESQAKSATPSVSLRLLTVCPDLPNATNLHRALVGGKAGKRPLASGKTRRYIGIIEKAGLPIYANSPKAHFNELPMRDLRGNRCGKRMSFGFRSDPERTAFEAQKASRWPEMRTLVRAHFDAVFSPAFFA